MTNVYFLDIIGMLWLILAALNKESHIIFIFFTLLGIIHFIFGWIDFFSRISA
jgi:hypothetical protein